MTCLQYASDFAKDDFFGPNVTARIQTAEPAESISVASMLFAKASAKIREYSFSSQVHKHLSGLWTLFKNIKGSSGAGRRKHLTAAGAVYQQTTLLNRIREDNGLLPLEKILEFHTLRLLEELLLSARKLQLNGDPDIMEKFDDTLKDSENTRTLLPKKYWRFFVIHTDCWRRQMM